MDHVIPHKMASLAKDCNEPLACKEWYKFQAGTDFIQRMCLFWDEEERVWRAKGVYFHQLSNDFEEYRSTWPKEQYE